jgi:uncharacterized protein DUF6931
VQSRLRFATAREVFDSFPSATDDIRAEPTDQSPLVFARALADGPTPEDAIGFCAYLLPRREAVWWACQCLRSLSPTLTPAEASFIEAAEAWVREPEDHRRRAALNVGLAGNRNGAATWVALAAGWSGGTMMAGENAVPCPPHLTAKAVRVAVLTGLARISAGDRAGRIRACLEGAVRLLAGPSGSAS